VTSCKPCSTSTALRRRPPDLDAETTARQVPVPARWFLGQPCLLRTDKAVAELGYEPVVWHAAGLDAVRQSLAVQDA